ncbi:MAG: transposase [Lachnospiraceae bacterium]|nr:transposase [Lachnospiraceae bacterium]
MGREQQRIKKQMEKNPVMECNLIQKRFAGSLFEDFSKTTDSRHSSYIDYSNKMLLGTLYYKGIAGISSMQSMTSEFNQKNIANNISRFLKEEETDYLPHGVTINEYLAGVKPDELQEIQQKQVYEMIRRKTFDGERFLKKWLVIVDGTQLYSGSRKLNDKCLERHYNKGTEEESVNYHIDVLEAKIVFGEKLIVSIGSEFIENNGEDAKHQKRMNPEQIKQDCEIKAFGRLAEKIKKRFPRLPITILADGLYAAEPVFDICAENRWDYIIRYKEGSIPSIEEEYRNISEKEISGNAEYINEISYKRKKLNVLKYHEAKKRGNETVVTKFQWITNIKITKKNAEKIASSGRKRWKIENEGFNRQKNWQGDITHACSFNESAIKNHYFMMQISDMIKQLYEWFFLRANEIKKMQKNISSELLASFGRQLTREDISKTDMQGISKT